MRSLGCLALGLLSIGRIGEVTSQNLPSAAIGRRTKVGITARLSFACLSAAEGFFVGCLHNGLPGVTIAVALWRSQERNEWTRLSPGSTECNDPDGPKPDPSPNPGEPHR